MQLPSAYLQLSCTSNTDAKLPQQKRRLNRGRVINATLPDDLWRHLLPHFTPQDLILISMLSRASNAIVMAAYDFWRKALPQHGTIPNFITPAFPYDWPTPPTSPDDDDKTDFNRLAHKLVALTQFVSPPALMLTCS